MDNNPQGNNKKVEGLVEGAGILFFLINRKVGKSREVGKQKFLYFLILKPDDFSLFSR